MTTDTSAEALERQRFEKWFAELMSKPDVLFYNNPYNLPAEGEIKEVMLYGWRAALAAEKRRAYEGVTDELVDEFWGAYGQAQGFTARKCPAHLKKYLKKALEAVWPDGRDAKDAARYRWLRSCGAAAEELAICTDYGWVAGSDFDETIDAAMKDTDHD